MCLLVHHTSPKIQPGSRRFNSQLQWLFSFLVPGEPSPDNAWRSWKKSCSASPVFGYKATLGAALERERCAARIRWRKSDHRHRERWDTSDPRCGGKPGSFGHAARLDKQAIEGGHSGSLHEMLGARKIYAHIGDRSGSSGASQQVGCNYSVQVLEAAEWLKKFALRFRYLLLVIWTHSQVIRPRSNTAVLSDKPSEAARSERVSSDKMIVGSGTLRPVIPLVTHCYRADLLTTLQSNHQNSMLTRCCTRCKMARIPEKSTILIFSAKVFLLQPFQIKDGWAGVV